LVRALVLSTVLALEVAIAGSAYGAGPAFRATVTPLPASLRELWHDLTGHALIDATVQPSRG
jgi:hypothetical protein